MSDDPLYRGSADISRWSAVCLSLLLVTSIALVGVAAASSTAAVANTTSNPIEFTYVNDSNGKITPSAFSRWSHRPQGVNEVSE